MSVGRWKSEVWVPVAQIGGRTEAGTKGLSGRDGCVLYLDGGVHVFQNSPDYTPKLCAIHCR